MKVQVNGKGKVLLQVLDKESRWGFYLTDGKVIWDGGFGFGSRIEIVPTKRRCPRLDALAREIEKGVAFPDLNKGKMCFLY